MTPGSDKALHKYLKLYAEPETELLQDFPAQFRQVLRQVLVVPFYQEPASSLQRLCAFIGEHPGTLLIAVGNRPETDPDSAWYREMIAGLGDTPLWSTEDGVLSLYPISDDSAVLLVDRVLTGAPLPPQQGVGLARKIGADLACRLIAEGHIHSPWIGNTDADATLPDHYFEAQRSAPEAAALVYPFRHVFTDDCPRLPTLLYEFHLHHYVEGLHWAGSPYAYHTIGSIIAVHHHHYAQVRGFPKRSGAEDFYLLNKLAKTGAIHNLENPTVDIQARHSDRVPFGTGPAVQRIDQNPQPLQMPLYHPATFAYLKCFLTLLQKLAETPRDYPPQDYRELLNEIVGDLDRYQIQNCCEHLKLPAALQQSFRQAGDRQARLKHLHNWFDGFQTRKLVHLLRDQSLGTIPFREWHRHGAEWGQPGSERMHELSAEIDRLTCTAGTSGE